MQARILERTCCQSASGGSNLNSSKCDVNIHKQWLARNNPQGLTESICLQNGNSPTRNYHFSVSFETCTKIVKKRYIGTLIVFYYHMQNYFPLRQYITWRWDYSNGCKTHMQTIDMATNLTTNMTINIKGMLKLRQAPTPHSLA